MYLIPPQRIPLEFCNGRRSKNWSDAGVMPVPWWKEFDDIAYSFRYNHNVTNRRTDGLGKAISRSACDAC